MSVSGAAQMHVRHLSEVSTNVDWPLPRSLCLQSWKPGRSLVNGNTWLRAIWSPPYPAARVKQRDRTDSGRGEFAEKDTSVCQARAGLLALLSETWEAIPRFTCCCAGRCRNLPAVQGDNLLPLDGRPYWQFNA